MSKWLSVVTLLLEFTIKASQSLFTKSGNLLSMDLMTRGFLIAPEFPSSVRSARDFSTAWIRSMTLLGWLPLAGGIHSNSSRISMAMVDLFPYRFLHDSEHILCSVVG